MGKREVFFNKAYQLIHRQGRVCLHCSSPSCRASLLCEFCESAMWKRHEGLKPFFCAAEEISGQCLFDWFPDQDRIVSKILISLKSGRTDSALGYYVSQFCSKLSSSAISSNAVLVPCPSRRRDDHARALAQNFHNILGVPIMDILEKETTRAPQKEQKKTTRTLVKMKAIDEIKGRHVIFIDDIVTTGSTAAAARNCLGLGGRFEVWCLARRRLLPELRAALERADGI